MPHAKPRHPESPSQRGTAGGAAHGTNPLLADFAALWGAVCRASDDYIVVVDRQGLILFCSRVDGGFKPEEVLGRSIFDLTTQESSESLRLAVTDVLATGEKRKIDTTVKTPSGELTYFSLFLGPVRAGKQIEAVMICCENTLPLKNSEASLRHERHVLRRLLKIQERERQLVSYEIHDGLAQYLAGAMMHLEACEHAAQGSPEGRDLREGLRLLRAAADEARRLISGLRPPALDELGIVEAVESLVAEARTEVPRVEFSHSLPARRLPADVETTIFRIVQESLSNIRRHASAGAVDVRIEKHAGHTVRIVIRDDGVGFDLSTVPEDRFGIEGIRQRALLLGGEPSITSSPGRGTTVSVTLPIDGTERAAPSA